MRQLFHCLQWYAGSERVNPGCLMWGRASHHQKLFSVFCIFHCPDSCSIAIQTIRFLYFFQVILRKFCLKSTWTGKWRSVLEQNLSRTVRASNWRQNLLKCRECKAAHGKVEKMGDVSCRFVAFRRSVFPFYILHLYMVRKRKFNFRWRGPPDSSVSSLILVGWCEEGHPATKNLLQLSQE